MSRPSWRLLWRVEGDDALERYQPRSKAAALQQIARLLEDPRVTEITIDTPTSIAYDPQSGRWDDQGP